MSLVPIANTYYFSNLLALINARVPLFGLVDVRLGFGLKLYQTYNSTRDEYVFNDKKWLFNVSASSPLF